jgi:hypothetical protein
MKLLLLLCVATSLGAQTAITELTSFWEMDITSVDRIAWDSKGSAHGYYWGKGMTLPASIFGGGIHTVLSGNQGGLGITGSLVNPTGSFAYGVWCRHSGSNILIGKSGSFTLAFNTGTGGFPQFTVTLADASTLTRPEFTYPITANDGDLSLVWFAYDNADGSVKIAMNGGAWDSYIPSSPFVNSSSAVLDIGNLIAQFGSNSVVGRTMFWNGYIPTDLEKTAIYNSGSGQDYSYFSATPFTPPARPVTLTLADATFAQDSALTDEGLYWLRPFPVKDWGSLASTFGFDYAWVRTKDHGSCGGAGDAVYLGGSNSPSVLPTAWTTILTAASVSSDDPTKNWCQLHTPHLTYNSTNGLVHIYFTAQLDPYDIKWSGLVSTTSDFTTWTFAGEAFPYGATVDGIPINHGGYATVYMNGVGDWIAETLINSTITAARRARWSSTDGLSWTVDDVTTEISPLASYGTFGGHRI